jgi:hypothetical protein
MSDYEGIPDNGRPWVNWAGAIITIAALALIASVIICLAFR